MSEPATLESCTLTQVGNIVDLSNLIPDRPTILDCRRLSQSHLVEKVRSLSLLIQNPLVRQVWIARTVSFREIKGRLKRIIKDADLIKLACHDIDQDPVQAFNLGLRLAHLGDVIKDFKDVSDTHPGISNDLLFICKTLKKESKRSGLQRRQIKIDAYSDPRRPDKDVFKDLKNFSTSATEESSGTSSTWTCYMCKKREATGLPSAPVCCSPCNDLNEVMRECQVDLSSRYAIVTGARIKIGYETSLRLLRSGSFVVATTRFPADALQRFRLEEDFLEWKHRLRICFLDLEDLNSVGAFLRYVKEELPHLDILVNNAAQTIYRPPQYFQRLETSELAALTSHDDVGVVVEGLKGRGQGSNQGRIEWMSDMQKLDESFPLDRVDEHGEQVDMRPRNSWTYNLDEIPLTELVQVLTVNAIGPFLLTSQLKPLLVASPSSRKFVVNVSAMEGQFSRISKGHRHAHTNMAKAALNMLTRTSGIEYSMDGIYMTAVDTGWVTDERPFGQAQHEAVHQGFEPPLSCRDGAARVFHPIHHGCQEENSPFFAVFLKDFNVHQW